MTKATTEDPGADGFSLIEVLVAMALMAVALLAVFKLQAQNLDLLSQSNTMTAEGCLAQGLLARIGALKQIEPGEKNGEWQDESPILHYKEGFSADPALRGFYRVRVEIWREGKGGSEPATYGTYLYRRDR
jgi:prepilin-type N-terminal cleavage/methylation domain-containing protein